VRRRADRGLPLTDLAFSVVLLVAGLAFVVYSEPLGARARARGAKYGRELYIAIGAFVAAWGVLLTLRELL
jgi:hypothetical protein